MLSSPISDTEHKSRSSRTRAAAADGPTPDLALPEARSPFTRRRQKLVTLQKTVGNQAVLGMLANPAPNGNVLRRKGPCGSVTAECDECIHKETQPALQRAVANGAVAEAVPPIVHRVLRFPGQPLDAATRAFMESRFEHDFGQVRLHSDAQAAESARAVNALAYTVGGNIVFGRGQYAPHTQHGRHLMAHELTHVVQQRSSSEPPDAELCIDKSNHADAQANNIASKIETAADTGNTYSRSAQMLHRFPRSLQRSTGPDRCSGSGATCASPDQCSQPDPGHEGSQDTSSSWTLMVNIDIEASSFEDALRGPTFTFEKGPRLGHTYVEFVESNGRAYTFGFYPAGEVPNENKRSVPGCSHHPDTTHDTCIDDTVTCSLNQSQYNAALGVAQKICRDRHAYGETYTCTTFADEVTRAAGQSLPSSRSAPMNIYYQPVPAIDNPNTLYENVQKERGSVPRRQLPYWNRADIPEVATLPPFQPPGLVGRWYRLEGAWKEIDLFIVSFPQRTVSREENILVVATGETSGEHVGGRGHYRSLEVVPANQAAVRLFGDQKSRFVPEYLLYDAMH